MVIPDSRLREARAGGGPPTGGWPRWARAAARKRSRAAPPPQRSPPCTIQGRFSTVTEKRNGKWTYVFVGIGELDEILTLQHYSKPPK